MTETTHSAPIVEPLPADDEGRVTLTLDLNGAARRVTARAHHTLVDVLRDQLGIFGVREGCGVGMCGACTVLLDGKPVSGCLVLAPLADGHEITTIEGLEGPDGILDPVQEAYVEHTAFQCSYCTPGFILATRALLVEQPDCTEEEARRYLTGNLCRCGSYGRILAAALDARDRLSATGRATADAPVGDAPPADSDRRLSQREGER